MAFVNIDHAILLVHAAQELVKCREVNIAIDKILGNYGVLLLWQIIQLFKNLKAALVVFVF